ncbi:MAG TPA: response regulator [Vicinamibacterales bacterium]|nr:response regulator [Vicinamibacterales bacterium]
MDRRTDGGLENGSLSVLVVDDDDLQRQFLARLLARAGIGPLFWATNGRSALEAFREEQQPIDVVVCDLLMPEMDGIEFLKQVSDEGYNPSIVISSGADEDTQREMETMARTRGLRVLGFIPKPVSVDALLTVLARHGSQDVPADTPPEPAPEPEVDPARRNP